MHFGLYELCFFGGAGLALLAGMRAIATQRRAGGAMIANVAFGLVAAYFAVTGFRFNIPIGVGLGGLALLHATTSITMSRRVREPVE